MSRSSNRFVLLEGIADPTDETKLVGFDILGYDEVFALFSGIPSDTWRVDITGF